MSRVHYDRSNLLNSCSTPFMRLFTNVTTTHVNEAVECWRDELRLYLQREGGVEDEEE